MGRWLAEEKGPGVAGDHSPVAAIPSGRGDGAWGVRLGELGRELEGVLNGKGEPMAGERVKRNMRASICQNIR